MSCATRLRRRMPAAEIVVLERGHYVSFANCGLPYFIGGEITAPSDLLLQTPQSLSEGHDLDVRVDSEVTAIDPDGRNVTVHGPDGEYELTYDELVLTPGARAVALPIPGIDSSRVHTVRTVDDAEAIVSRARDAERAVVIGGGFIGVETAEGLARAGLAVAIVEAGPHVLPPVEDELVPLVHGALSAAGVAVVENTTVTEIAEGDGEALVRLSSGDVLGVDLVVLSAGVRPATEVFERGGVHCDRGAIRVDAHGRTNREHVWAAGDAVASVDFVTGACGPIALAGPANRAGRLVADAIADPATARDIPASQRTAIVRAGDLTVAMTGATRRHLDEGSFFTIHLHPAHHATYFPGAEGMSIVLHVERGTGRILGAQAAGGAGVDKRVDVIATAMRGQLTAPELMDLDLCYSPPYGAAKDPITMAGLIADNVLTGQLALWYAEDIDEVRDSSLLVDVRGRDEYAGGHIAGAVNIPHTQLRSRVHEVAQLAGGRPVRLYCASGYRSYLAHTVLAAAGFDSASLSGGMYTLLAVLGERTADIITTETQIETGVAR